MWGENWTTIHGKPRHVSIVTMHCNNIVPLTVAGFLRTLGELGLAAH